MPNERFAAKTKKFKKKKSTSFLRFHVRSIFFVLIFLLLQPNLVLCSDIFSGPVEGNWKLSGSPYYVWGSIYVDYGHTLLIDPGVEVYFAGGSSVKLEIFGDFYAIGTETSPIVFSSGWNPSPGDWDTIRFYNSGTNDIIKHAIISGANKGVIVETKATEADTVAPIISNCKFFKNTEGIFVYGNAQCACFETYSVYANPIIDSCIFEENETAIHIYGKGTAAYHYPNLRGYANPIIRKCVFANNPTAIFCEAQAFRQWNQQNIFGYAYPQMTNNIVYGSSIGVSFYARSDYNGNEGIVQANLSNMVIQSCDTGIFFSADNRGTTNAVLSNSIVSECTTAGIDKRPLNDGTISISTRYNDFWNNSANCTFCSSAFGMLDGTNANGDSCDSYFNIFLNPNFTDVPNHDYHLQTDSPCIDAGNPEFSFNDACLPPSLVSEINDVGAYGGPDACILHPPDAVAGPDRVVYDEIALDGDQSTDFDGDIVSYSWQLFHRENSAFDRTADGKTPTISNLEYGFYDVVLTVTDNNGLVDTDSMFLAVGGQKDCVGDYDNDRDVDAWDLFKFSESFGRSDCLAFSPIP